MLTIEAQPSVNPLSPILLSLVILDGLSFIDFWQLFLDSVLVSVPDLFFYSLAFT